MALGRFPDKNELPPAEGSRKSKLLIAVFGTPSNERVTGWGPLPQWGGGPGLSLAVVNVLPLPALYGGRFALIAWTKVTGRKLSAARESQIHTVGFVALLGLMVVVTFLDIRRLF